MPERFVLGCKLALSAVLLGCVATFVALSWRWPLVGDAPLMHYVVFLMQHGWAPYREIADLNLPGTYAAEAAVMRLMGPGALAWRLYDFGLLAVAGLAMGAICGRRRWFAALFAASVFALIHGRDGLIQTGQRDLLMTALLLLGCAALQTAAGGGRYWASGALGLTVGAAATVKPLAILLLPVWFFLLARALRSRKESWSAPAWIAGASAAVPLLLAAAFLLYRHTWEAFLWITARLVPLHASMFRLAPFALLRGSISSVMLGLFLLSLPLFLAFKPWHRLEEQTLLAGFVFGVVSFYTQGRGYPYHRYPSEAFLLLLAGTLFDRGLRSKRRAVAAVSIAGLAFGSLVIVPRSLAEVSRFDWRYDEFGAMLGGRLNELGGAALSGKVQCLDQAGGCIAELYKMKLMQSTGFLYDCYLFIRPADASQAANQASYQAAFLRALRGNPPAYFVVTSDECGLQKPDFLYGKLARWPVLDRLLRSDYAVIGDEIPRRKIAWGGVPALPYGFRVYARKPALRNNRLLGLFWRGPQQEFGR